MEEEKDQGQEPQEESQDQSQQIPHTIDTIGGQKLVKERTENLGASSKAHIENIILVKQLTLLQEYKTRADRLISVLCFLILTSLN